MSACIPPPQKMLRVLVAFFITEYVDAIVRRNLLKSLSCFCFDEGPYSLFGLRKSPGIVP